MFYNYSWQKYICVYIYIYIYLYLRFTQKMQLL